jgi:hypothetical protein
VSKMEKWSMKEMSQIKLQSMPQNQESSEESVANVSPQERLRRIEQLESKLSKYINPENQKKGKRK